MLVKVLVVLQIYAVVKIRTTVLVWVRGVANLVDGVVKSGSVVNSVRCVDSCSGVNLGLVTHV